MISAALEDRNSLASKVSSRRASHRLPESKYEMQEHFFSVRPHASSTFWLIWGFNNSLLRRFSPCILVLLFYLRHLAKFCSTKSCKTLTAHWHGSFNSSPTAQELYWYSCVECTFGADCTWSVISDKSLHEHSRPRKLLQLGHKQFSGNNVLNNNYQVCSSGGAQLLVHKDLICTLVRVMWQWFWSKNGY